VTIRDPAGIQEIRVTAGGVPTAEQLAALTSALTALVAEEGTAAQDPLPPAYRSRWRRAGLVEMTEVPPRATVGGPGWGGRL
jgi:Acyl-CoA carboxylase epsilon subunit